MSVRSWRGVFIKEMTFGGSGLYGTNTVKYTVDHSANAAPILCSFLVSPQFGIWQSDGARITNAGTITERQSAREVVFYKADGSTVLGAFSLTINQFTKEYTIQFPNVMADVEYAGTPAGESGASFGPMVTIPLPQQGMILAGAKEIPLNVSGPGVLVNPIFLNPDDAGQLLSNNIVTVAWNLEPASEAEVILRFDPPYEAWVPEGDTKNAGRDYEGNSLKITASTAGTCGTGAPAVPDKYRFELLKVSREPGVCMNFPRAYDEKPDFRFNSRLNPPAQFVISNEGTVLETAAGTATREITATLSAYDFGAFGRLKVSAFFGTNEVIGYRELDPQKAKAPFLLPKRKETSLIADYWKEQAGATALFDDEDGDDEPVGDGHTGDGLSLYEEYRGFSENRKHLRTDPKKKDYFVNDTIGDLNSTTGLRLFAAQSGLRVHGRVRRDETLFNINFNYSSEVPHLVDQFVIHLMKQSRPSGVSFVGPDSDTPPGTPAKTQTVQMDPGAFGWTTARFGAGRILTFDRGAPDVAHELGHTCAVWHHGDGDRRVRWVVTADDMVFESLDGENALPINVYTPDAFPYDVGAIRCVPAENGSCYLDLVVGIQRGEHSGDEACFMRYHYAESYKLFSSSGRFYRVHEKTGHTLCTSPDGTGVNHPDFQPIARYGAAAANRGNCKSQICVNDGRQDSPSHNR